MTVPPHTRAHVPPAHRAARFHQAAELLDRILRGALPADRQIDAYFRAHRSMGSRDRAFAATTIYGCLRRARTLERLLERAGIAQPSIGTAEPSAGAAQSTAGTAQPSAGDYVAAWLLLFGEWSASAVADAGFAGDAAALAAQVPALDLEHAPLAVRADLPDALVERLVAELGEAEALALAAALNEPASLDIRVNTWRSTRAELRARLKLDGIDMESTPISPWGLRRADRAPLFQCASFREGWFEVQDEGSQLIAPLLHPQPRERIADFCAGAGGKTLQLAALMTNSGVVYAMDVSARRLDELRPRLRRSGLQNVRLFPISHERDRRLKRLAGSLDGVLVDAPCSGTGTIRRNPDLKWRPLDLGALQKTQLDILTAAAQLVRPGGRLVYATCSLLRAENQEVVAQFLEHQPTFSRSPLRDPLAAAITTPDGDLTLLPHRHGTDGFYAAVLACSASE